MDFSFATKYINVPLLKEPMNWALISIFATLWLLAFHVVMTGWGAMTGGNGAAVVAGPGQINSPVPDVTTQFTLPASMTGTLGVFDGGGPQYFTEGYESRYAEDGWTGNV